MQGQCLYSPFSSFFPHPPGEWVGSKGLRHQQLPFSSFLTLLAFIFNIPFISTSLIVQLFSVFLPSCYLFIFLFVLWPLCFPSSRPSFSSLSLSLYLTIFHIPIVLPCFPTQAIFPLHPQFHLTLSDQISHTPSVHFSFHLFVFLDYRLLSFFRTVLEKWEGEGKRGEERGGNKAPQSQRDSLSLSGFNLLIRSSRTHRTLHLNNTSYPPSIRLTLNSVFHLMLYFCFFLQ